MRTIPTLGLVAFAALAALAFADEKKSANPAITSTRFQYEEGFALVTYGYFREASRKNDPKLAFVVIETHPHNSSLSSRVHFNKFEAPTKHNLGWRLPPAYIDLGDGVVRKQR